MPDTVNVKRNISIVIPTFNEEENIPLLYQRLKELSAGSAYGFEFIFIDDGSSDGSYPLLKQLSEQDQRLRVIRFSRNFGSHAACLAGMQHAAGDACSFIAADLQDPPEVVLQLAEQWMKGYDVVMGVRDRDGRGSGILSKVYWKMVRRFALKDMPETGFDVFLIDRKVVDAVSSIGEKNTSVFALILWSGFNQALVTYKKMTRQRGVSKWTLGKKIKLFVDTFVSFSFFPIRMISLIGILIALAGFMYAALVIFLRLFRAVPIEGWTSLMVVILVISGVQLIMIGVLGEYLWRNFDESRKRPSFIIREMLGMGKDRD